MTRRKYVENPEHQKVYRKESFSRILSQEKNIKKETPGKS